MSPHSLCRLALAASLVAAILPIAHGTVSTPPPAFADPVYVLNGCHISSLNFIARFNQEFPHERAELARVLVRSVDDLRIRHTIALFTWQGAWWCRDDIVGLAALEETVNSNADLAALAAKAEAALDRVEARQLRQRRTRSSQPEVGAISRPLAAPARFGPPPNFCLFRARSTGSVPAPAKSPS